jgi:spermidine synthase
MGFKLRNIYFLLFALSGFSGLVYESIWTHYLKLFLGHAAYAQTLVLAIFMGGMAIGSWLCSRYSPRWENLLRGYAFTEGIIGLCALLFHPAFARTIDLSYTAIIPHIGNPATVSAFKYLVSTLMILPQSVLLGMTFPLMSAGILRLFPDRPGNSIAMLYFANSIGAAVGVMASGFLLIRLVGLPGTMVVAGLINLTLAATVWSLLKKTVAGPQETVARQQGKTKQRKGARAPEPPVPQPLEELCEVARETAPSPAAGRYRLFLLASLVTGASSFIYEIGWIRMLSLVLGSSTHAFELMLGAFIFGLACGGLWLQRRIDRVAGPVRYLAWVQLAMGLLALSTLPLYGNTFAGMRWLVRTLSKTDAGYLLFNLSSSAIAMAIMWPATFCAGMTLPLITFILIKGGHGERSIGAVYATNTVGAIVGVFFAIHLGMPLLGLKGVITLGAGLDIALGMALFWSEARRSGNRLPLVVTVAGSCAVAVTLLFVRLDPYKMGSGVYRTGVLNGPDELKMLYHRDGKTASVSCFLQNDGIISLRTNGKPDAAIMMEPGRESSSDEPTMILLGAIPMALNPQAATAASIGLGSGLTSHTLLCNPRIREVDTVEIEQGMIEAAKNFRPRVEMVFSDPRSKIHNDDAKTFFSTSNKKYDLIVSEPSNPWVSGVAGLFSTEFYRLIGQHMNDDGLFVQWVQLYEINTDLVASVLKSVATNFSDYAVYATNNVDIMIVARKSGPVPHPDATVLKIPAIADALQRIHVAGVQDLEFRKIGDKRFFARLLETLPIPANSDYYPVLDQGAARARFLGNTATELLTFRYALQMLDSSALPRGATNVTPSPDFALSQTAFAAMGLRDFFLRGAFNQGQVPDDLQQKALLLKDICAGKVAGNENNRLGTEYSLAFAMSPYLSPAEMDAFWGRLAGGPCDAPVSPRERACFNFFKAFGERDGAKMLEGARTLLASGDVFDPNVRRFFLVTGMLGALAQGERAESSRLWSQYGAAIFAGIEPDLLLRLLLAESAPG